MKKQIATTTILIFALLVFSLFQYFKFSDNKLHIVFCNVGEGDGVFIRTPKGFDILFDSGPDDSVLNCLSSHMPFWDRDIELAVLSHPHADHMRGFLSVFQRYSVKNFATENLSNTTDLYKEVFSAVGKNGLKIQNLYAGDTFRTSDGFSFKILGPTREFLSRTSNGIIKESSEDGSLLSLLSIGRFFAVLTGDSPLEEISSGVNAYSLQKVKVFEIPHHGSRFNLDQNVLSQISPDLAVISVGKNTYGHPSDEVLKALSNLKIPFIRTDQHGDVEIIADKNGSFNIR